MMDNFKVIGPGGDIVFQGASLRAAALAVLGHGGRCHQLRRNADDRMELLSSGWWRNSGHRGWPLVPVLGISSTAETDQDAEDDIYRQVIAQAERWDRLRVITGAA